MPARIVWRPCGPRLSDILVLVGVSKITVSKDVTSLRSFQVPRFKISPARRIAAAVAYFALAGSGAVIFVFGNDGS